ncbi:MAG: ABC transporter permease [Alphaproteobacteria bacterium]|nr:ABC transporter permease [Alphaproteobacteria bacterium]
MFAFVVRRLLATIPVMGVVALFVFSLLYFSPGDPAAIIAGDLATVDDIQRVRIALGLDQPFHVRFGTWLWAILNGDLGTSIFSGIPVSTLIGQRLEATISLSIVTLIFAVAVAIPLGVVSAWRAGGWIDRLVMGFAVFGFSVPVFVLGYLLIFLFALELDWLPVQGFTSIREGFWPFLRQLILPALALGTIYIALIARMTRAAMLDVLAQDYIRTARAKGAGRFRILLVHALKNIGVPVVTVVGTSFAALLGGVVVTESVFNIPGAGRLTVEAILTRDYPVVQGVMLVFAVILVGVNLLVDLSYTLFDPRIRHGGAR